MKISELIKCLTAYLENEGDKEVVIESFMESYETSDFSLYSDDNYLHIEFD